MKDEQKITLYSSKKKMGFAFLGSVAFVAAGVGLLLIPKSFAPDKILTTIFHSLAGLSSISFFGFSSYWLGKKLFDKKPALIIDNLGITDNSSALPGGLIRWEEIEGFTISNIKGQKILMVHIFEPEKFIEKQKGWLRRKLMRLNLNWYDAPVGISVNGLPVNSQKLLEMLQTKQLKHQQ